MAKLLEQVQVVLFLLVQQVTQIVDLLAIRIDIVVSQFIQYLISVVFFSKLSLTICQFRILLL